MISIARTRVQWENFHIMEICFHVCSLVKFGVLLLLLLYYYYSQNSAVKVILQIQETLLNVQYKMDSKIQNNENKNEKHINPTSRLSHFIKMEVCFEVDKGKVYSHHFQQKTRSSILLRGCDSHFM